MEPRLRPHDVSDDGTEAAVHLAVDQAKRDLGERGPVWWSHGAPDLNRMMAKNIAYTGWFITQGNELARFARAH